MVELAFGVGELLFGAGEAGAGLFAAGEAGAAGLGAAELGGLAEAGITAEEAATLGAEGFDFGSLGAGGAIGGGEAFGLFGPGAAGDLFGDVFGSLTEQGFSAEEASQLANQIVASTEQGTLSPTEIQQTFQSVGYRDPFAGVSPSGEVVTGQFEGFGTGGEGAGEGAGESAAAGVGTDSAEGTAAVGGEGPGTGGTGGTGAGTGAGGAGSTGIGADSNASVEGIGNSSSTASTTAPGETAAEVGAAAEAEAAADAAAANAAGGQQGSGLGGQVGGQVGANVGSIGPAQAGAGAATGVAQGVEAAEAFGPDVTTLGPDVVQALAQEPVDVAPDIGAGSFQGPASAQAAGPASTASTTTQGGFSDPASFLGSPQAVTPGTAEPGVTQGETLGAGPSISGTEDTETLTGLSDQDVMSPTFNTDITETPDPGVTDARGSISAPGLTGPGSFATTETAQGVAANSAFGDVAESFPGPNPASTPGFEAAETEAEAGRDASGFNMGPALGDNANASVMGPGVGEPGGPTFGTTVSPAAATETPESVASFFGMSPEEVTQGFNPGAPQAPAEPGFDVAAPAPTDTDAVNALGRGADEGFTGRSGFAESPNVSITSAPVDPTTDFASVETDPDVLAQEPNPSINQAQALGENAARGAAAAPGVEDQGTYATGKDAAGFTDQGTYDTAAAASGAGGGLFTPTNALLAGGLLTGPALSALLASKKGGGAATQLPPQGVAAAGTAATTGAAGTSELARAINLDLTPAERALLDQQERDRRNRAAQLQFSAGITGPSTMAAQQESLNQQETLARTKQFVDGHMQNALALLGQSATTDVALSQQQIKLQADFDAMVAQTTQQLGLAVAKIAALSAGTPARVTI